MKTGLILLLILLSSAGGYKAEWVFIALKPKTYSLRCPTSGHTEAGMQGKIAIASSS